jgi:hypothetical protein
MERSPWLVSLTQSMNSEPTGQNCKVKSAVNFLLGVVVNIEVIFYLPESKLS